MLHTSPASKLYAYFTENWILYSWRDFRLNNELFLHAWPKHAITRWWVFHIILEQPLLILCKHLMKLLISANLSAGIKKKVSTMVSYMCYFTDYICFCIFNDLDRTGALFWCFGTLLTACREIEIGWVSDRRQAISLDQWKGCQHCRKCCRRHACWCSCPIAN